MDTESMARQMQYQLPDIELHFDDWKRIAETVEDMKPVRVDRAPTRRLDPVTSYEAARTVSLNAQRYRVMELMWSAARPLTDFELLHEAKRHGYKDTYSGLGSRRLDLVRLGLLEYAHDHGVSPSGNRCRRYWLTEYGKSWCVENLHN